MDPNETSGVVIAAGVIIGALAYTLWSFIRRALARDISGVLNMGGTWLVGIISTYIACSADIVNKYAINGVSLNDLDGSSRIVVGLIFTSVFAMVPYDVLKAIDGSRTSALPNPFAKLSGGRSRANAAPSSTPGPSQS